MRKKAKDALLIASKLARNSNPSIFVYLYKDLAGYRRKLKTLTETEIFIKGGR